MRDERTEAEKLEQLKKLNHDEDRWVHQFMIVTKPSYAMRNSKEFNSNHQQEQYRHRSRDRKYQGT